MIVSPEVSANRFTRRRALRGAGVAASAGLFAATGSGRLAALAQDANNGPLYTTIRRYTLDGSANQIEQTLAQGYIAAACAAKGFVAYFTVDDGNGTLATVAVFESQKAFEDFADDEANWIAQNLSSLPSPDETIAGQTAVSAGAPQALTCPAGPQPTAAAPTAAAPTATAAAPTATAAAPTATAAAPTPTPLPVCTDPSRPGVGCGCTTGANNACGDNTLVCCANAGAAPGGPGTCTPSSVGCNPQGPTPTPAPCTGQGCACTTGTQSPCDSGLTCCQTTGTPGGPGVCQSACQPCTGEGCTCNGGVQGNCDSGLVCCQNGQSIPGGQGTCTAEANCAPAPCTGQGCDCNGGVQGACDDGLVCCQGGAPIPGGSGTCEPEAQCTPVGGTPVG